MIVCPNCNHSNPDGAQTCEACYTPLPATTNCPSCGTTVQTDASFCGQCGFNLKASTAPLNTDPGIDIPDLEAPEPLVEPQRIVVSAEATTSTPQPSVVSETAPPESEPILPPTTPSIAGNSHTQLQQQVVKLLHVQTNTTLELPQNISVVHIGKPNDKIPPDIDVSGFPNSEIVSRIHADIRVEGDAYFVEDVGSSNGTYINSKPLQPGDRHRLRKGDRIALGKGDLMTFLVQS